jgi:dTMP kinase
MIPRDPDRTILIDMDPTVGLARAKSRNSLEERFEDFGISLQQQMRDGFLALSREFDTRFCVINGMQGIDAVQSDVIAAITPLLP